MLEGRTVDIVVPVFNNAPTLQDLADRCHAVIEAAGGQARLVFVNDASRDNSAKVLDAICVMRPGTLVIDLPDNGGQQNAIRHGLAHVRDLGAVMDADLQDPPEAIQPMLACLIEQDHDVVFGTKHGRYQSGTRMLFSRLYRRILGFAVDLPKGAGCFVAMSAPVAKSLARHSGPHFYLVGLIGCGSYSIGTFPVNRERRGDGQGSGYSFSSRLKLAILNFNTVFKERIRVSKS